MAFQKIKPVMGSQKEGNALVFDYKNAELLRKFTTESGSILNRERTGLAAKQQRALEKQVKRARHLALLPFVTTL